MASIGDMLSDLSNFPENHPFLTEALPTIAGAVLMARRGRNGQPTTIGAPLGAGLLAGGQLFGNYAKEKEAAQQAAKQQKLLASTFGAKALPLPDYIQQGGDLKVYREAHPIQKPQPIKPLSIPGSPVGYVGPDGKWVSVAGAPTVPVKTEKPTSFQEWKDSGHPHGTYEQFADFQAAERRKGEKPERPREVLWAPPGGGPPAIVNLDTGTSRPLPALAGRPAPRGSTPKSSRYVMPDGTILDLKAGDAIPSGAVPISSYGKPKTVAGEYWYSPADKDWKWVAKGDPIPASYTKSAPKEAAAAKPTRYMLADGTIKDFLPGEKVPPDAESLSSARKVSPAAAKGTTPQQAIANVKNAQAIVVGRLGKPGGGFLGFGAGPVPAKIAGALHDQLAASGLSDSGYPLKNGQKVKLSDGRIVTWTNP